LAHRYPTRFESSLVGTLKCRRSLSGGRGLAGRRSRQDFDLAPQLGDEGLGDPQFVGGVVELVGLQAKDGDLVLDIPEGDGITSGPMEHRADDGVLQDEVHVEAFLPGLGLRVARCGLSGRDQLVPAFGEERAFGDRVASSLHVVVRGLVELLEILIRELERRGVLPAFGVRTVEVFDPLGEPGDLLPPLDEAPRLADLLADGLLRKTRQEKGLHGEVRLEVVERLDMELVDHHLQLIGLGQTREDDARDGLQLVRVLLPDGDGDLEPAVTLNDPDPSIRLNGHDEGFVFPESVGVHVLEQPGLRRGIVPRSHPHVAVEVGEDEVGRNVLELL
jgi:hypothetical protein